MSKKYSCLYCSEKLSREELVSHIEKEHDEMLPEGFSANRVVFNLVNKKAPNEGGCCVVCKRETPFNENSGKYDRLCGRKQCLDTLRKKASENMVKVYGKTSLLEDPDHQMKMLANRKISGKYKFTDNGYHVYTGSYEKKALEFIDQVLGFKSTEILCPGPTLEYEYEGNTKKWITDIYIIPLNLIIEVKDGGSSPNNRPMDSYRAKQVAKEELVTSLGKFNYLRLTDNDFSQLLYVIAQLKMEMLDDTEDNRKVVININEEVEALKEDFDRKVIDFVFGKEKENKVDIAKASRILKSTINSNSNLFVGAKISYEIKGNRLCNISFPEDEKSHDKYKKAVHKFLIIINEKVKNEKFEYDWNVSWGDINIICNSGKTKLGESFSNFVLKESTNEKLTSTIYYINEGDD